jgi:hypothetical protein
MAERKQRRRRGLTPPGPLSLFRNKVREPVSLTLTKAHHEKVKRGMAREKLTRADFIGLLIERHADDIQVTPEERARLTRVEPFQPSKPETIVSAPAEE